MYEDKSFWQPLADLHSVFNLVQFTHTKQNAEIAMVKNKVNKSDILEHINVEAPFS